MSLSLVDEDVVEQEQERQLNRQHISLEAHGSNPLSIKREYGPRIALEHRVDKDSPPALKAILKP